MHPEFPDWYRSAGVAPPSGLLAARWEGVSKAQEAAGADEIVALARLFVLPRASDADVPADFRKFFKDADEAFPSKGNLQEMKVLAGATLRLEIAEANGHSATAALALLCGAHGSRQAQLLEAGHLAAARAFIVDRGAAVRELESAKPISKVGDQRIDELITSNLFVHPQTANLHGPLTTLLKEIARSARAAANAVSELRRALTVRSEEVDALWWLQTAYSTEASIAFPMVGPVGGALVLATELATITRELPGLPSAPALLSQALHLAGAKNSDDRSSIGAIVNATPLDWRRKKFEGIDLGAVGPLCPVILAAKKSLEAPNGQDWFPVYQTACDVSLSDEALVLEFALQAYFEWLLVRSVGEK